MHARTRTHTHSRDSSVWVISPSQKQLPAQQIHETNMHALSGIRTRNPGNTLAHGRDSSVWVISPSQRQLPAQQIHETNIHALSEIRTRNPGNTRTTHTHGRDSSVWVISPSQGSYLHSKYTRRISIPSARFEPAIPGAHAYTYKVGTSLDEWSARRRDSYLHSKYTRRISMPSARFEPAIPGTHAPHTHTHTLTVGTPLYE